MFSCPSFGRIFSQKHDVCYLLPTFTSSPSLHESWNRTLSMFVCFVFLISKGTDLTRGKFISLYVVTMAQSRKQLHLLSPASIKINSNKSLISSRTLKDYYPKRCSSVWHVQNAGTGDKMICKRGKRISSVVTIWATKYTLPCICLLLVFFTDGKG